MRPALFSTLLAITVCLPAGAAPSRVAVAAAANLLFVLEAVNAEFQRAHPDVVLTTTSGASGGLFAQIQHGAPFDVFLSADTDYPRQLVQAGLGDASTLRSFATGRLVFWTKRPGLPTDDIAAVVRTSTVRKIAVAHLQTAPYGRAAQAALETLAVWPEARAKLVVGENIAQTAQFIETGNADAGFVALSLVKSRRLAQQGTWTEVPPALYRGVSLEQAGVLTRRGAGNASARTYLAFLGTEPAKKILREFGYDVPK